MKLKLNLARKAIAQKEGQNHLVVEICPRKEENKVKKSNAWVFVIDTSGSMNSTAKKEYNYSRNNEETKIEYAKSSIISFLNKLDETDKVGVVEFANNASVVKNLTNLKNKSELIKRIRKIEANGMTNIDAGINLGRSLFSENDLLEYNCKLLILSDGDTNCGRISVEELSSMCLDFSKANITVSCLGIGVDYNSFLLNKMATTGGGYLYHIDTLEKLESIFSQELELSNSILAKSVELEISMPTYFEIESNMNDYYEKVEDDKKKIFIGDISGNRKVAIPFKNNHRTEDAVFNITCKYKDKDGQNCSVEKDIKVKVLKTVENLEKNMEVVEYILTLIENKTNSVAYSFADSGDSVSAQNTYLRSYNCITAMADCYNLSSEITHATLNSIHTASEDCAKAVSTGDKDFIKAKYSTSTSSSRK